MKGRMSKPPPTTSEISKAYNTHNILPSSCVTSCPCRRAPAPVAVHTRISHTGTLHVHRPSHGSAVRCLSVYTVSMRSAGSFIIQPQRLRSRRLSLSAGALGRMARE